MPAAESAKKNYCFTLHFEDQVNKKPNSRELQFIEKLTKQCTYLIYGEEIGEASEKAHYQGYVQLAKRSRITELKKLNNRVHWEAQSPHATNESARIYCTKEKSFTEIGEFQQSSGIVEKERWKKARIAAIEGRLDDVDDDIFIRHYSAVKAIAKDYMKPKADLIDGACGYWYYGVSGGGKSFTARKDFPGAYLKMANKWWDGYQNQEAVILDDLDKSHACLAHHLKLWTDEFPFIGENKNGAFMLRPKYFCVTSQYTIDDIFEDEETRVALNRRFQVKNFPQKYGNPKKRGPGVCTLGQGPVLPLDPKYTFSSPENGEEPEEPKPVFIVDEFADVIARYQS